MKRLMTIGFVSMIALCATAHAEVLGTVNITGYSYGYADTAHIWGPGVTNLHGRTGIYTLSIKASDSIGLGAYVPNWGFCTELTEDPTNGPHTVITLETAENYTPAKALAIRELWGRFFNSDWALTDTTYNNRMAEAFNACIWEIVHETNSVWEVKKSQTATRGIVYFDTDLNYADTANTWLNSLQLDGSSQANDLYVLHGGGQDFLVQVPEPATLAILALGSLCFRRIKKA